MAVNLDAWHTKPMQQADTLACQGRARTGPLQAATRQCALLKGSIAGHHIDLAADGELISQDGPGPFAWIVKTGIVRMQRFGYDGRRQVLSLSFAGEVLGYERVWREGISVEAATPCSLCRIDRRELVSMLQSDAALRAGFLHQQQDQLERLRLLTWSIGALHPHERLAGFLAAATRFLPFQPLPDGTGILSVVLSRADIADLLATTVETISRILHQFEQAGLLTITHPSRLHLLDQARLRVVGRIEQTFDTLPYRDLSGIGAALQEA